MAAVSDHFIDVHVRLGSGTRLPNNEGELRIVYALEDF